MTRIAVERAAGPVRLHLAPCLLQPRLVSRGGTSAQVALVASGATLLGGDEVAVDVEVGDGCTLGIEDVGGTVAYESTGTPSRFDVHIRLGAGARLIWRAHPFVVTDGADVRRRTAITLGEGAALLLRETLVLGRTGERGGHLATSLEARGADGVPLLIEHLDLDGASPRPGVLGGHRVLDTALLLGRRPPEVPVDHTDPVGPRVLHLEQPGAIGRALGASAHATGVAAMMEAWAPAVGAGEDGA